ncbi:C2H2 zinc finger transcription factor [Lithospermum erythrorhizon]|uniref:C2H2 zinc finger transcription factor n=1 Tax=Lithospermum erythrorhizon TaxID=34254 RepID=A0AAV3RUI2_LITER
MPPIWFALKRSLHCKTKQDEVHDPRNGKRCLSSLMTKRKGKAQIVHGDPKVGRRLRSGCSRSIANLKDVINGSKRHIENPAISPRSIGSSELLNPITHEVIVSDTTCELKITNYSFLDGNGRGSDCDRNIPTFVGMIKPGTPGPRGHHWTGSPGRSRGLGSPVRRTPTRFSRRRGSNFHAISFRARCSSGADSHGFSILNCKECGDQFGKWEAFEMHHLSNHAVTELVEGDSSRRIVEIICRTSTTTPENNGGGIERILKVHNMQKTVAQFEEYREIVKIKASKLAKKHPRCLADGNELLRFYGTYVECSLGINGSSRLCTSDRCNVCRILRKGFSSKREISGGVGVFTASTSSKALESVDFKEKNNCFKKALVLCRVIAGRVHRPLENIKELIGHSGFDSLAGKVGVHSNIEELYLLNPKALLPCFVVIFRM